MMILRWLRHKGRGGGEGGSVTSGGLRQDSEAATRHQGARMCVLAFVGGDNYGRVVRRPLHSLLHATPGSGATVVAPAQVIVTTENNEIRRNPSVRITKFPTNVP